MLDSRLGAVCSAHVDVSIKLSGTLPDVPGYCVACNVHGVRQRSPSAIPPPSLPKPRSSHATVRAGVRGDFLAVGATMSAIDSDPEREAAFDQVTTFDLE